MHIHCAAVADEIPAPHAFKDEFAREHLAFMFSKEEQELVFLGFDGKWLVIKKYLLTGEIDDQISEGQFFVLFFQFVFCKLFLHDTRTAQLRFDARHQFTHGKGLG